MANRECRVSGSIQLQQLRRNKTTLRKTQEEAFAFCWRLSRKMEDTEKKERKTRKKAGIVCDFVDFALVDYLSVHAYHHFYM